jgi:hypothetical protein
MNIVYRTPYNLVTEQNGAVTIKRQSRVIMIISMIELVVGILSFYISRMRLSGDGGIERFCFWIASVILTLAIIMLIGGLFQGMNSKIVFDLNSQKMRRGSKVYEFSMIDKLTVERTPFAGSEIFFLTAFINGTPIKLTSETTQDSLEEMAGFLSRKLAATETVVHLSPVNQNLTKPWAGRHFTGILLIALGLIWSGSGFFLLQNVIFSWPRNGHGPLIWPLGIWIALLGMGDLIGMPVDRAVKRGAAGSKIMILIMLFYFGSYFLVCWR